MARSPNHSILAIPYEHYIGIRMTAHQRQLLAIELPVEVVDVFRSEIGNLPAFRAIGRLEP